MKKRRNREILFFNFVIIVIGLNTLSPLILENINIERLGNNPRKVNKELLKQFLDEVFV